MQNGQQTNKCIYSLFSGSLRGYLVALRALSLMGIQKGITHEDECELKLKHAALAV